MRIDGPTTTNAGDGELSVTGSALPTTRPPSDPRAMVEQLPDDFPIKPDMLVFAPFTPTHAAALLACVALITTVVIAGRRLRFTATVHTGGAASSRSGSSSLTLPPFGADLGRRSGGTGSGADFAGTGTHAGILVDPAGRLLGAIGLVLWVTWQLWWLSPAQFSWESSLPLHICDLAGLLASLALLTGSRTLTTLLVFWGLGLSTQAYATPVVRIGPGATEFWIFWESHTLIIGAAVYCIAVRRYRARWGRFGGDLGIAFALTLAYLAVMLPLDVMTGWNYGYVGNARPKVETVIDKLGPWPMRLLPMAGLVLVAFGLVQAGFRLGRAISSLGRRGRAT